MSGSESQTDDESLKQDDDDRLDDDIDEHDSPLESTYVKNEEDEIVEVSELSNIFSKLYLDHYVL